MNKSKTIWANICFNKKNFTVNFYQRDENYQTFCTHTEINIPNINKAKNFICVYSRTLEEISFKEKKTNLNKKIITNLFYTKITEDKLNPDFKFISKSPIHSSTRNVINEIIPYFFDVDGNFVEQFQTTGFDSRLWELYLFCYFNEEGITINRKYSAPDFYLTLKDKNMDISLEAVIVVNKNQGNFQNNTLPTYENILKEMEFMPSKWGSPLYSKLTHKDKDGKHYWEYEHTIKKPFVIAIADFHELFSMVWSHSSLITYLYGYDYNYSYDENQNLIITPTKVQKHKKNNMGSTIPSGFFFQENTENISAILHTSCGTISKFHRIGKQCGMDENNILMYRTLAVYNNNPNAVRPNIINYFVTEESDETWGEGVTIFHNPNAKYPLPHDFFYNATQCYLEGDEIIPYSKHPIVFSSTTNIFKI